MHITCFGDSNTYGFDPRSWFGGRYDADTRWPDILAAETGWPVSNMGQNGRVIPETVPSTPAGTDLLIVMLGNNDLLNGSSPEEATERLRRFLCSLAISRDKILLIAPPPMALGEWVADELLIDRSRKFSKRCEALAGQLSIRFTDAGE